MGRRRLYKKRDLIFLGGEKNEKIKSEICLRKGFAIAKLLNESQR